MTPPDAHPAILLHTQRTGRPNLIEHSPSKNHSPSLAGHRFVPCESMPRFTVVNLFFSSRRTVFVSHSGLGGIRSDAVALGGRTPSFDSSLKGDIISLTPRLPFFHPAPSAFHCLRPVRPYFFLTSYSRQFLPPC